MSFDIMQRHMNTGIPRSFHQVDCPQAWDYLSPFIWMCGLCTSLYPLRKAAVEAAVIGINISRLSCVSLLKDGQIDYRFCI